MARRRYIYLFGGGRADGTGRMLELLGGKGAGLAEMSRAGIPVPPGFTISTEACRTYLHNGGKVPPSLDAEMRAAMKHIERLAGARFGDPRNPLLVSVRSGAAVSMPGMMDTILNVGLNDRTVEGLAERTRDGRFAYDCYRRLIMMLGDVVDGVPKAEFEAILEARKRERGMHTDLELTEQDMRWIAARFLEHYEQRTGRKFPQDPWRQLIRARDAVFRSWNNERARIYRRIEGIPDDLGTACTVQAMVFGNMGAESGTGVGFTRDPSTGEPVLYGEFLRNAQGEDVVAGVRTPVPISLLATEMPQVYREVASVAARLERHRRDMQDFEFTIQNGRLFMLQTRRGKRSGRAALRIACDLVREKRITPRRALLLVEPRHIEQVLHPEFDPAARREHEVIARGLNASPGAATGVAVFDPETAVKWAAEGRRVILVRRETSPDDIAGMRAAQGFLTSTGGMTSHAAVVGRGMGKPAVVGAGKIIVREEERRFTVDGTTVAEGDPISIDGSTGEVLYGEVPTVESEILRVVRGDLPASRSELYGYFERIMEWADRFRRLGVRANADTPEDARLAVRLGAEGIGLCRTEHMFFGDERIPAMQEMILAETAEARARALQRLLAYQEQDFLGIFEALEGRPATIRTLDPPLHEFLPAAPVLEEEARAAENRGDADEAARLRALARRAEQMREMNPMLGHRGCRLGITHPEITQMQARAIFRAAARAAAKARPCPEIMIPLVGHPSELEHQKRVVEEAAREVLAATNAKISYRIGTMIEVPRAALTAAEIAAHAEFFSFGTNDLTQMTLGMSRDDAGRVLRAYIEMGLLRHDPFQTLDTTGVGRLMQLALREGRKAKPSLKVGICGEHGGDPGTIAFCHRIGLDYVSCSPFRVPVARLAAAHAALAKAGRD